MKPLISIIIATYNRAKFIKESLISIQNQTFENWECLIIDDGSSDGTALIISDFAKKDPRFIYHKRKEEYRKGISGCRNQGLDLAKGDYIIFFDDDDIVHPENLKTCINILSDNELFFCRYDKKPFSGQWKPEILKPDKVFTSKFVGLDELENVITGKLPFASCTVMWKTECFKGERFNEDLLYAEEWELYTRILSKGIKGCTIDKILYNNRKHANSNTGEFYNNDLVRRASNLRAIKIGIENLSKKDLLSPPLVQYFIKTGFLLNDISIIKMVLDESNAGILKKYKYLLGFNIYPVLKPLFNLKAKFKKY